MWEEFNAVNQPFLDNLAKSEFQLLFGDSADANADIPLPSPRKTCQVKSSAVNSDAVPSLCSKPKKMFECEECNARSRTKYQLIIHVNTKHKGFYFLCPVNGCNHPIKTKSGVKTHIHNKHSDRLSEYLNSGFLELVTRPEDNKNGNFVRYEIKKK